MNHKKSTLFIIIALATINFFAHGAKEKEVQEEPSLKPKAGSPEFNDFIRVMAPSVFNNLENLENAERDFVKYPGDNPNIITTLNYTSRAGKSRFQAPGLFSLRTKILAPDMPPVEKLQTAMDKNLVIDTKNISGEWITPNSDYWDGAKKMLTM